jgi:hypothetical protein
MTEMTKTEMTMTKIVQTVKSLLVVALILGVYSGGLSASATPALVNAKDMFYQELQGGGTSATVPAGSSGSGHSGRGTTLAYCLELHRGNAAPVLCNNRYKFRSGDGLRLHVKSSTTVYAYIGLLQGSSGKKDILLYPNSASDDNRIQAGKECMVPPKGMIVFDNTTGVEHLAVIFLPQPMDGGRALSTRSLPIDSDSLTGIPQKVGNYSVFSNDGVYDLGVKAPGNGLVYVNNPDASKGTAIALSLNHGNGPAEPPASTPHSSSPPPSSPPRPSGNHATSSSSSGDSSGNRAITDKWAFIVGLNHFANFPQNSLRYCVADATALRDFLVNEAGFKANHVYLLTDEQATTANIKRVMTELLPRAIRPDDLVLLYFSTHGTPEMGGENFIVTYDFDGKGGTGVPMSTLSKMIKSDIPSNRIVTLIDTCFSGNAKDLDGGRALDDVITGCGQLILTACNSQETSLEDPKIQHGYFTYYLIDSLRKQRKIISSFDMTRDMVQSHTQSEHGHSQHPVLKKYWTGNDVMIYAQPTNPRN